MDRNKLNEVISALNSKNVNLPCPRCSHSKFSIVGRSEIEVIKPPQPMGLRGLSGLAPQQPVKVTMPVIIVTCDNCGFVAQHAEASLDLPSLRRGLRGLGG